MRSINNYLRMEAWRSMDPWLNIQQRTDFGATTLEQLPTGIAGRDWARSASSSASSMRETFHDTVDALQADLDDCLVHDNTERPHLGFRNQRRSRPIEIDLPPAPSLKAAEEGVEDVAPGLEFGARADAMARSTYRSAALAWPNCYGSRPSARNWRPGGLPCRALLQCALRDHVHSVGDVSREPPIMGHEHQGQVALAS